MTKKELRKLRFKFYKNTKLFDTGLCNWSHCLWRRDIISEENKEYVDKLIETIYPGFETLYVWKRGKILPRLFFIWRYLR